ncbi:MAG: L-sorbosone dehydrogenase [Legionellales bacterium]|nr:L-sorbosone dehydrogenase [Legionellales bacterium]|tara:strand:- start:36767 stop:37870 length:1104 start_codon:yes stop_codon:yes gene_type:complete
MNIVNRVVIAWCVLSVSVFAYADKTVDNLTLPKGFKANLFIDNLPALRQMALGDKGTVFVGSLNGEVYGLVDTNNDGRADTVHVIAKKLNYPNGVAVHKGDLYIAEIDRITRYHDIENHLNKPPKPEVIVKDLPDKRHHGFRFIKFGPDDKLYLGVGAPCNVCLSEDKRLGTIMRVNADGSELEVFAKGVRNTVGFDWEPGTDVLWFTDNGRDWLGDHEPPDELNRAPESGMHFGFPYVYGNNKPDPKFGKLPYPQTFTMPVKNLPAHVAALGMVFYQGNQFPKDYQGDIFIAEHGSWNSSKKVGYRVSRVKHKDGTVTDYQPFVTGFLEGDDDVLGRPVALLTLPDGSLLISDDFAGKIYRVGYGG